jgi:uncharacterized protein (TIGR02284 family)
MSDVARIVNDLIATCRASEQGFGRAAKGVHSDNLRTRFTGIALQRAEFADELAGQAQELGVEPTRSAHLSSRQQAGWRELETSIRPEDDATFLAECQMGEENTLRHFEQALTRQDLTPVLRAIVERLRLGVQETILELRTLEQVRHV